MELLKVGKDRLRIYLSLPSKSLKNKFLCVIAGFLNVSLSLPSLMSRKISYIYDVVSRWIANKIYLEFENFMVRSCDCEGLVVFHPTYEERLTVTLLKFLRKGSVFVDVGAHVGRYAILASRRVGEGGLVVALEPVPETYLTLLHNIRNTQNSERHSTSHSRLEC